MKYDPKKVFILENGIYIEITYKEFCIRKKEDTSYESKSFIPLHGMLMEVTKEAYSDFYRAKEHMDYLEKLDKENSLLSLDALCNDDVGIDHIKLYAIGEYSKPKNNEMLGKLRKGLSQLNSDQRDMIRLYYYDCMTEFQISEIYGITQQAVSKRLIRIRKKLKKFKK